ncbi:hypothetical protein GCWU000342_00092 [Shuttleworthella satelles DSM 14600]|uniref:Uncharacterized protein n=1 Tax=Shuttleworthella satelles DSM 14600 TaxID=626523 RepID=C4G7Y0_9FIRM|nr:hypothetical protein GCWU000342_00092 [Shuttleworthia satelles DSM 14600]
MFPYISFLCSCYATGCIIFEIKALANILSAIHSSFFIHF